MMIISFSRIMPFNITILSDPLAWHFIFDKLSYFEVFMKPSHSTHILISQFHVDTIPVRFLLTDLEKFKC